MTGGILSRPLNGLESAGKIKAMLASYKRYDNLMRKSRLRLINVYRRDPGRLIRRVAGEDGTTARVSGKSASAWCETTESGGYRINFNKSQ
jgi:hypothetical protein